MYIPISPVARSPPQYGSRCGVKRAMSPLCLIKTPLPHQLLPHQSLQPRHEAPKPSTSAPLPPPTRRRAKTRPADPPLPNRHVNSAERLVTKGRQVVPIPQLECVGGDGKGKYEVDVKRIAKKK